MRKNSKFIWFYTIVLFSSALALILIAGMSQQNYREEIKIHQTTAVGMQKSVSELTARNEELRKANQELKTQNETLSTQATENQELMHQMNESIDVYNTLSSALREYNKGRYKTARNMLEIIDKATLTEPQLYIYNIIMK